VSFLSDKYSMEGGYEIFKSKKLSLLSNTCNHTEYLRICFCQNID